MDNDKLQLLLDRAEISDVQLRYATGSRLARLGAVPLNASPMRSKPTSARSLAASRAS